MKVAIIDYGAGNIFSVQTALRRLSVEPILTANEDVLRSADRIILPGVGQASAAMEKLEACNLTKVIPSLKQPLLGVCLGMQLLCNHSEEENTTCLGIIPTNVKRFSDADGLKIPHMGWNTISNVKSPLMRGVEENSYCYFVHSYYAEPCQYQIATCSYPHPFAAALNKDNFWGCQFHPEKSSLVGEQILKNFLDIEL